ncbi:MAG: cobalamin biosynthesis protein [Pseudomonadota bacterium]
MRLVAGFGFRAEASVASLSDALARAEAASDGAGQTALLASAADKCATQALQHLAQRRDLPLYAVEPADLVAQETSTRSQAVQKARRVGSVAEASALAAAGAGAVLVTARVISEDRLASCALARIVEPGDRAAKGTSL